MTVGLSAVNTANAWLNVFRGNSNSVTFTGVTQLYVELHTGDPGSAGTSNVSSYSGSRPQINLAAAASGSIASSNTPSWSNWAGTNGQVITHVSFFSSATQGAGTFYFSIALTASKTMSTGDTLNLTSGSTTISLSPIAA